MPKAPRQSLLFDRFRWYLSLARPCRRIWEELQKQGVITSDSIVQLPKHLPKNRSLGVLEYNFPKAAIVFEVFFGAVAAGRFLCEPVGEVKVGWWKMTVGRLAANIIRANLSSAVSRTTAAAKGFTIEPLCGLVIVVPSFSRARSASRTGDRLTSNFCAKSTSAKWSPGLKSPALTPWLRKNLAECPTFAIR
jgi:hypothetical protein